MYEKIGENEKSTTGTGSAMSHNLVVGVRNETVPLIRVEVGAVFGFTKEKNGDKANGWIGNVKGIIQDKGARWRVDFNGAHAKGVNGVIPQPFDWVGRYGAKSFKVQKDGGDMTRGTGINYEGQRRWCNGRRSSGKGGRGRRSF
jgi:hypothetical protein